MKRLLLILFLYIFLLSHLTSQVNKYGVPHITNYSPQDYEASEQNWAIVQDERGIMYFGNNDNGVLEYDGETWRQIPISNQSSVRSLAIDKEGTIYVGAIAEFGFLAPDKTGKLGYISLIDQLDSLQKPLARIDKIIVIGQRSYFSTVDKVYYYRNKQFKQLYKRTQGAFYAFEHNSDIYLGHWVDGLNKIQDSIIVNAKGSNYYAEKNIFVLLPYTEKNEVFIGARTGQNESAISIYNTQNGSVKTNFTNRFTTEKIKSSFVYNGIKLSGNNYSLATLNNGMFLLNNEANITGWINETNGLQDETVISVYRNEEQKSPLWLSLNIGISKVEIDNAFSILNENDGYEGLILDIIEFDNTIHVATSSGVYYLNYIDQLPVFKKVENLNQGWSFLNYQSLDGDKLLVASSYGIFEIKNNKAYNIESQCKSLGGDYKFYLFGLYESKFDKSKIYIASKNGLSFLSYNSGIWDARIYYVEPKDVIRSIYETKDGKVWLGTNFNGVIRLNMTKNDTTFKKYGLKDGLPSLFNVKVYELNGEPIFATQKGFYRFNSESETFYPENELPDRYSDGSTGIFHFSQDNDKDIWISAFDVGQKRKWVEYITKKDGDYISVIAPFKRLLKEQPEVIYHSKDSTTWIGISNVLYCYDKKYAKNYSQSYNTYIRKVVYREDSVIFSGAYYKRGNEKYLSVSYKQPVELIPILEHQKNALTFSYAAPFFEKEEATVYSYLLKGYNNQWSKWSEKAEKGYTNLDKGKYKFEVKAKNVYDVESEIASFEFSILPPWYQTIIAYISYIILAIVIVYVIVKLYTRRLEQEKIRLEGIVRERTAEVVAQKDEIEEQRDEIQEQKQGMEDSIHYASRIQRALLPGEVLRGNLPDHFILFKPRDIVSGDFYWMANVKGKIFIVAADCTGHGVPGAFMSMLGMSFLNEIVVKGEEIKAREILNQLRNSIISALKQTGKLDEAKDGMDLSLYIWDKNNGSIEYAGANNPLYFIRLLNGEELKLIEKEDESFLEKGAAHNGKYVLNQIKADKMPIGIYVKADIPFSDHVLKLEKGYAIYTFSDGYVDQFGGESGKKFMTKKFKKLLLEIQEKSMNEQHDILDKAIEDWKAVGEKEQVDDILVFGVKM